MSDDVNRDGKTRHLQPENLPEAIPNGTGPLEYMMPWVIKLRVVGTTEVIQVEVSERMIIGRADKKSKNLPDIDLQPFNAHIQGVSHNHAEIAARNSRITVRDLDSANGTYLNDGRLKPGVEYRLRHGDRLVLGKLALQVQFVVMPSSHEKNDTSYSEVDIRRIGRGQRILLVDDDEKVAEMISRVLKQAGFEVMIAYSGSEALTLYDKFKPVAVLLELLLPDMGGLEIVHYIRERDPDHAIPIMVVSGATGGYQTGQAVSAGADILLTKPVGVDELMKSFGELVT